MFERGRVVFLGQEWISFLLICLEWVGLTVTTVSKSVSRTEVFFFFIGYVQLFKFLFTFLEKHINWLYKHIPGKKPGTGHETPGECSEFNEPNIKTCFRFLHATAKEQLADSEEKTHSDALTDKLEAGRA